MFYCLSHTFPGLIWFQFGDLFAVKTISKMSIPLCGDQLANDHQQARVHAARMYFGRFDALTAVFLETQVLWEVRISGVSKDPSVSIIEVKQG